MLPWQRALEIIYRSDGVPIGQQLLVIALVACSIFLVIQLIAMWGTKWGDHNAPAKSLYLSFLVHLCLGLGWSTAVLRLPEPVASDEPVTESTTIRLAPEPENITAPPESTGQMAMWETPSAALSRSPGRPIEDAPVNENSPTPTPAEFSSPTAAAELPQLPTVGEQSPMPDLVMAEAAPATAPIEAASDVEMAAPAARAENQVSQRARQSIARNYDEKQTPAREPRQPSPMPSSRVADVLPTRDMFPAGPETETIALRTPISANADFRPSSSNGSQVPSSAISQTAPAPTRGIPSSSSSSPLGIVRGVVRDAVSGEALAGVTVRIDLDDGTPVVSRSRADGTYELSLPQIPDHVAVTAFRRGYLPESQNLRAADVRGRQYRRDFALRTAEDHVIAVESEPIVHHLGNDKFEGRANSQFQHKSEGEFLSTRFAVLNVAAPASYSVARLTFLAKGIQCPPQIRVNGHIVSQDMVPSPDDGSFGSYALTFNPAWLQAGDNVINVRSVDCNGDMDDFEVVNLQIRLIRR